MATEKTKINDVTKKQEEKDPWITAVKYCLAFVAILASIVVLFFVAKFLIFFGIYALTLDLIMNWVGLDYKYAVIAAIGTSVVTILLIPTFLSFVFLGRKKMVILAVFAVALILLSGGLYYSSDKIFFDRTTGIASKYYIKTLEGYKFSNKDDYNPFFGVKYKPVTEEVIKEYYLWKKTGSMEIPPVVRGKYFDMISGEAIVWYVKRSDGKVFLFSLPGHDPKTGAQLLPMTKELVDNNESDFVFPDDDGFTSSSKIEQDIERMIGLNENEWEKLYPALLDFYLKKPVGVIVSSGQINRNYFERYNFTHTSSMMVEKIIFLQKFTIIGLSIKTSQKSGECNFGGKFFNVYGTPIKELRVLDGFFNEFVNSKDLSGNVDIGSVYRIFYIFEGIPLKDISRGKFNQGDAVINFSVESSEKGTNLSNNMFLPPPAPPPQPAPVPEAAPAPEATPAPITDYSANTLKKVKLCDDCVRYLDEMIAKHNSGEIRITGLRSYIHACPHNIEEHQRQNTNSAVAYLNEVKNYLKVNGDIDLPYSSCSITNEQDGKKGVIILYENLRGQDASYGSRTGGHGSTITNDVFHRGDGYIEN